MSPDELLRALERFGFRVSRRTLQRYTKAQLLSEPKTGSLGRGRGRYTEYPAHAVGEAAASILMVRQGWRPEQVARIRYWATYPFKAEELERLLNRLGMELTEQVNPLHLLDAAIDAAAGGGSAASDQVQKHLPFPLLEALHATELDPQVPMLWYRVREWVQLRDGFNGRVPLDLSQVSWQRQPGLVRCDDGAYRWAMW